MKSISPLNHIMVLAIWLLGIGAAWWLVDDDGNAAHGDPASDHNNAHAEAESPKGPRGGRLLNDGLFTLELTLFERGIPPEFRVYAYYDDQIIDPNAITLSIELKRLDGRVDRFDFEPGGDFLRGQGVVREPHSFDVTVNAGYRGKNYRWEYENYEGRTTINAEMAAASNIRTDVSGPGIIRESLSLTGHVQTDPNRLSQVRARFPGIVNSIGKELGDKVDAGDVLATVQSNESLQTYSVKAPIAGLIVRRDLQIGQATGDSPLFVIADLSRVWVELNVFGSNLTRVRQGQHVTVESLTAGPVQGLINWISPLAAHASQSVNVRVELDNDALQLRPGQFVRGHVVIAEHAAPVVVRTAALQTFRDFDVVFARYGDTFEVRMLTLGKRDDQWVEVIEGLEPGVDYVTGNSYLIKADIEKSGASHDH